MPAPEKKTHLNLIIRAAVSLILVGALVYHIGSGAIISQMRAVPWQTLLIVIALLAGHVLIITPRWANILRALGYQLSSFALIGSVFLGFLFNQLLPTAVGGDVIRAWRAQQLGVPWDVSIHSVLFDRASGVVVVLLGALLLVGFADPMAKTDDVLWIIGAAVAAAILIVAVLGILRRLTTSFPALKPIQDIYASFEDSFGRLLRHPWLLFLIGLLALVGQLIPMAAIALLARALNVQVALVDVALISFVAMLAAAIPISVAGWGVREGALVYLFGLYGVPPSTSLALSLSFGACLVFASLPGILPLLAMMFNREKRTVLPERVD